MVKYIYSFLTIMMSIGALAAQSGLSLTVKEKQLNEEGLFCTQIVLNSSIPQKSYSISGQNYRLFYNSDNLSLIEESVVLDIPTDNYHLQLVQHRNHINAKGVGKLDFESDLGFINLAITQADHRNKVIRVSQEEVPILSFCFTVVDPDQNHDVVLARPELTSSYGRAYVELSTVNDDLQLSSVEVDNFVDYRRP